MHPDRGALVIEVRGGQIAYDAETDVWTSTSRAKEEHTLTGDPVDQAKDAAYGLRRYLRGLEDWPSRWGTIGYAVCFPDGELRGDPPPHLGPVLIDESHVRDSLRERIEEILD